MQNLKLNVAGMTCGSCVRRVEQALARVDDVVVKRVDRSGAELEIADDVDVADIVDAVKAAGYDASVEAAP